MSHNIRFHLDDRGLSRPILEMWIPSTDADALWYIGQDGTEVDQHSGDIVPMMVLSPMDVTAVMSERSAGGETVIALFESLEMLEEAIDFGLEPCRVTIHHLAPSDEKARASATVFLTDSEIKAIRRLTRMGFEFVAQPLPNTTGLPLSASPLFQGLR